MSMSLIRYSWASSHIRWLNGESTITSRIISVLMMRTEVVLEVLVDSLSTYLTQLLAWEYFIGCKNCYVTEFQNDVCMFIHKAQNIVVYQEYVLLSQGQNMIHRQKSGRLSYNKLNTWVSYQNWRSVGNNSEFSNLEKLTDGQVLITFGYENPRLDLFVIHKEWNNSEYSGSFRDVWRNVEALILLKVHRGSIKFTGIHKVFISVIA